MIRRTFVVAIMLSVALVSRTDARRPPELTIAEPLAPSAGPTDGVLSSEPRFALAAVNTTVIAYYTFEVGSTCSSQGWTVVDGTAQIAEFWHVDDFAGVNVNPEDSYAPLAGSKSLWCGARAAANGALCGYLALPGYGNQWNQVWQTKACVNVAGNLDVSFLMEIDSEETYDATLLEYTTDCVDPKPISDWNVLDGGIGVWDGVQTIAHAGSYLVPGSPGRVRLRFESDGGFSDEDASYDSHAGPVVIDNLSIEGGAVETFEGESIGATESEDWEASVIPGYGASFLALFPGTSLLQQDACARNLSCMWSAIFGSTETYACGGHPEQAAMPKGNSEGQYLDAEIWSPLIPLPDIGTRVYIEYSRYFQGIGDNLQYLAWDVRSVVDGCEGPWIGRNFFGAPNNVGWRRFFQTVGGDMEPGASHMRVKFSMMDLCEYFCGVFGSGLCHDHSPLLDTVEVFAVDVVGPVYSSRDMDMFQDTFPGDGSATGIGRADAALSITASSSSTILPGDSARVIVSDPITAVAGSNPSGLASDDLGANNGNKACYLWVHVIDSGEPSATKTGAVLSGGPHYPFKDTVVANGKTWTRIQCWLRILSTSTFVVDLNDNLFEAGDVIEFFFGATNTNGQTSYSSGSALNYVQSDLVHAAETAGEFTIFPLDDPAEIFYVDGMDGRGAQSYWDTAFEHLGISPHRFDVRGPTSSVSNRPGARVNNVANQLNSRYKFILWDSGDIPQNLGDGTGMPEKSNDYGMVNQFLAGLTTPGGIYLCGDDYPAGLTAAAGASAVTFKTTYVTYTHNGGNHRPTYGISPVAVGVAGGAFSGDTFVVNGGCPLINDFDYMTPSGTSVKQIAYNAAANHAAVVSKVNGNARAMISGFSFIYIRDDEEDGVMDRAKHLHDILTFLGGSPSLPTDTPASVFANALEQNYPNPFNPQTTIAFSLKARSHVRIDVFDVTGAHVRTLLDEARAAGSYSDIRWDGRGASGDAVASGVYFYQLVTDGFSHTKKMVLLK